MRTGLLITAALATALVSSTALADRTNDYDNKMSSHAKEIKERVLDQQKEGHVAATRTEVTRTTTAPQAVKQLADHRTHGDTYENYGKSEAGKTTVTHTASGVASKAGAPAALQAKGGEEMADGSAKTSQTKGVTSSYTSQTKGLSSPSSATSAPKYGPMGKQIGWSAGGKTTRSFTHFVNDKGQINNNPHGSTATAMHSRHQLGGLLSAMTGGKIKLFSWEGSGGDKSEDAEP